MFRSKEQLKKVLAKTARHYRKSHGLTQEKFAELLGITPRACSSLENQKSSCSGETMAALFFLLLPSEIQSFLEDYQKGIQKEQAEQEAGRAK